MIMLGDFDQQPPIGGTSLPNLSMTMLRKQHLAKRGIFNVKQSRKQEVEINSTLSKRGVDLFQQAAHIRLTVQYRCTDDPNHMALLTKMNSGSKISPSDLSLYTQLTKEDLTPEKFLFGTIIVTGNYERHKCNAFKSQLWAHTTSTPKSFGGKNALTLTSGSVGQPPKKNCTKPKKKIVSGSISFPWHLPI